MSELTRRKFVLNSLGLLLVPTLPVLAAALPRTPSQSAGPFYPVELPLDNDNDLTRVEGFARPALGEITDLSGRILSSDGAPLSGMRIEIWQCDANGRYHHPQDSRPNPRDDGFQGHGHTYSNGDGRYRFRTIHPVPYPGRTPHIHVAVFPDGQRPFVTQLYVAGDPGNASDWLYQRIPVEQRGLVSADFRPVTGSSASFTANWDLVLGVAKA